MQPAFSRCGASAVPEPVAAVELYRCCLAGRMVAAPEFVVVE